MNAYFTVCESLTWNPLPFQCACWKPKNIATLIAISATVITGKRRVGMLSLSGSSRRRLAAREGHEAGRPVVDEPARQPAHLVSGRAPSALLAPVLGGKAVVLRTVDLDDPPVLVPDEVGLLTPYPHVEVRQLHT